MKKRILMTAVFGLVFLASCKKTYTCECNEFYNGADTSWTELHGTRDYETRKKEDAVADCDALDGTTQTFGTEEYGLNCELK